MPSSECADNAFKQSATNTGWGGCATKPVVVERIIWELLTMCATLGEKHRIRHLKSHSEFTYQSPPPDDQHKILNNASRVAEPIDPPRKLHLFGSESRCTRRIHVVLPPSSMNSTCWVSCSRLFWGITHDLGSLISCLTSSSSTARSGSER